MNFYEDPISCEKIFAYNVKKCREVKGLTQKELAVDILGYPVELLQKVEEGLAYECILEFCVCLAKYFGISLDDLLTNRHLVYPPNEDGNDETELIVIKGRELWND